MSAQHVTTRSTRTTAGGGPGSTPRDAVLSAAMETLEQRRMLTVEIEADGFLIVNGTNGDDEIIVALDADDRNTLIIDDNGDVHRFDIRDFGFDIKAVQVSGFSGADRIEVDQSNGAIRVAMAFLGGSGDDTLIGGAGHDLLDGGAQSDEIYGGSGDDRLDGGGDNDTLVGDRGDDHFLGRDGDDFVRGRAGNDIIQGGEGFDTLNGGSGDDEIRGDDDDDTLDGGAGYDTLRGGRGNDEIDGNRGRDFLFGEDGDDILLGFSGDDQLFGGRGDDELDGEDGDDSLDGGEGRDLLFGSDGFDTFSIRVGDRRADIQDFDKAEDEIARFEDRSGIIRKLRGIRR